MKHRLTQTLLGGSKPAETQKPHIAYGVSHVAKTIMRKAAIVLLLALSFELSAITVVYAGFDISNTALLEYSDNRGWFPTTVTDTAAIRIVDGPSVKIAKDVFNTRTGETSPDIVDAYHGDMVLFKITIVNTGDYYARYVEIADSIPVGTMYETGTALDSTSFDTANPPDQVLFQHQVGGAFDQYDTTTVTAIKWLWNSIGGEPQNNNSRIVGFRVKIQ